MIQMTVPNEHLQVLNGGNPADPDKCRDLGELFGAKIVERVHALPFCGFDHATQQLLDSAHGTPPVR